MTKFFGDKLRVAVDTSGDGSAFTKLEGEQSCDFQRASNEVDTTDKSTGAYGTREHRRKTVTITGNGQVELPSPALAALNDAGKADDPNIKLRLIDVVGADQTRFEGQMSIGDVRITYPDAGVASYSFTAVSSAVPVTDDMIDAA
jgi:hypothetical protein